MVLLSPLLADEHIFKIIYFCFVFQFILKKFNILNIIKIKKFKTVKLCKIIAAFALETFYKFVFACFKHKVSCFLFVCFLFGFLFCFVMFCFGFFVLFWFWFC